MTKTPRNVVTPVRLTEKEREAIGRAAKRENESISEYMRSCTITYMAITGNSFALSQVGRGTLLWVRELREKASGVLTKVFG